MITTKVLSESNFECCPENLYVFWLEKTIFPKFHPKVFSLEKSSDSTGYIFKDDSLRFFSNNFKGSSTRKFHFLYLKKQQKKETIQTNEIVY